MPEPITIDAHGRHAQCVRFTKDGKLLVSAGQDAHVRLWAMAGFDAVASFAGHKNSVNSLSFTHDDRLLATGSSDGSVRVWSFPAGAHVRTFDKQGTGVFARQGDRLATLSAKGQVTVWEASSGKQVIAIPPSTNARRQ
jgi:WD40 repeat protein